MRSVYDNRTEKIRKALDGERASYEPNKVYQGNNGYAYYINSRGFYHILVPGKLRWSNGEIMCYTINDYRLSPDNTMYLSGQTDFDTPKERQEYIEKLVNAA